MNKHWSRMIVNTMGGFSLCGGWKNKSVEEYEKEVKENILDKINSINYIELEVGGHKRFILTKAIVDVRVEGCV